MTLGIYIYIYSLLNYWYITVRQLGRFVNITQKDNSSSASTVESAFSLSTRKQNQRSHGIRP